MAISNAGDWPGGPIYTMSQKNNHNLSIIVTG